MWMRLEVQLATAPIGYVRVQLGRGEVGVPEHLLDAAEVGPALQEVRGERVAEEVRMDPPGLETGSLGQPAQDQERARARERAAPGVEEELGAVPRVEVRAPARQVAPERIRRLSPDRDETLLRPLAEGPNDAFLEMSARA